jgi:SAM-dependent methyltransferase
MQELALRPGESVLEVGCGHGRTLVRLAETPDTHLAGVDPSDVMVRLATRKLRRTIAAGRAEISLATSAKIPHRDARFDAAFAVHVVYFWRDPLADLHEIHRVLRPGGRLLLGYRPRDAEGVASLPASVYTLRSADAIEALLAEAGFTAIRTSERVIGKVANAFTHARRAG